MRSRLAKALLMMLIINAVAGVALADLLSPFSFSFFNPVLTRWFFLPFTLVGCV